MESKQTIEPGYCVSVTFVSGKDLTSRDLKGGGDPYCILKANGNSSKTQVFKGYGKNPVWNRRLDLISKKQENKITIRVMDWDRHSKDDLIGETVIDVTDLWAKHEPYPPFQWVDIYTTTKGVKKCEGSIQIQIECKKVDDAARLNFLNYTHLITAIVSKAENLRSMDRVGSNDTKIELQWGVRTYRTQTRSGENPLFNEAALFCVDADEAKDFLLKVSAFDQDRTSKRDFIGEGYVLGRNILDKKLMYEDGQDKDDKHGWITLSEERITKDVNAEDQIANHMAKHKSVGRVKLKINVKTRAELEDKVLSSIMADFDKGSKAGSGAGDGQLDKSDALDGQLSKDEVASLVSQCAPDMEVNFDKWFRSIDSDGNGTLSKAEFKKYMSSTEFMSSSYVQNYIRGHELCTYSGNPDLMEDATSSGGKKRLFVVHRVTNQVLEENIPGYISVALKAMFSSGVGRVLSRNTTKLMTKLSKRQGRLYDNPKSKSQIDSFVKLHDLNMEELVLSDTSQYKTFNDFFARAIKPAARPIAAPNDPTVCVSPADCRMMVFENIVDASKFWVKGSHFTLDLLLGDEDLAKHFYGGSFCIARLSPQDYHRWHMPVDATHGKVTPIAGSLYTVNPIAINQPVNVYTENKRCVIELDSEQFGKVVMVAVGATMVGSYHIFGEEGQKWQKGKVHGEFRFGGSTVLLLFEPGRIKFDDDLIRRSQGSADRKPTETLLQVNTRIGVAVKK